MDVLLVSPDERTRGLIALAVRSIERRVGSELRFRAARNGDLGLRAARRERPEVIVADEIASRAGAFSLARSLRDDAEPYEGAIVILLDRPQDAWLARWSGADAWFVKPVDPFELADRLLDLVAEHAPNLKDALLARHVVSTTELEAANPNFVNGDCNGGSHHPDQNFFRRPIPGWSRYATPIKGLYQASAATWPGGGVHGAAGELIARQLLR